ncbi:MAG: threonine synthase [Anaerolineae bacterium]
MEHVTHLRCVVCDEAYAAHAVDYVCACSGDEGLLEVAFDHARLAAAWDRDALAADADHSMWRYAPLLPVHAETLARVVGRAPAAGRVGLPAYPSPLAQVGGTPLYDAPRVAANLGLRRVWIKDDGRNPTASLKDRASALVTLKAVERGADVVTTASSGNAAAALAAMTASVGLKAVIFVPQTAPPAKIAQLLTYGAEVYLVKGTYDEAFDLCLAASREYGWYCRNTGYNPYTVEGKKTVSFEICEQLGWQVPDRVFVSVGDGCIIDGVWKGFKDMHALGWIDRLPKLVGVQAAGSDPLVTAWESGTETIVPVAAQTVADSICVGIPRDGLKALRAVRESGGRFMRVGDDAILAAIPRLAQEAGVFVEPAASTAYAGLLALAEAGALDPGETVVVIATGNGLKDVAAAMRAVGAATQIEPTLAGLAAALAQEPVAEPSQVGTTA